MESIIKVYDIVMTAIGPIYIGSGNEIAKKEYAISQKEHTVSVMDQWKLTQLLQDKNLTELYVKFMLGGNKDDVGMWLYKNNVKRQEYLPCVKYRLDYGDAEIDTHSKLSILEFVKDAYGMPYIPGSSLKGMFRTILLSDEILNNRKKYQDIASKVWNQQEKASRNTYLKRESEELEKRVYRRLERKGTNPSDAVNDILSGFIVSDSEPLKVEDLVLCQRIELHTDGTEKKMPVLRETIKPGTEIRFQLSIDTSVCDITQNQIEQAIATFGKMYYDMFLQKYSVIKKPNKNTVWLGGGSGFVTKTEVYSLFGEVDGLRETIQIFKSTGVPANHKHDLDRKRGVSPHICKVAYYGKQRYQMGEAGVKIIEKI